MAAYVACGWRDGTAACGDAALVAVVLGEARVPACPAHALGRPVVPIPPHEPEPLPAPLDADPTPAPADPADGGER